MPHTLPPPKPLSRERAERADGQYAAFSRYHAAWHFNAIYDGAAPLLFSSLMIIPQKCEMIHGSGFRLLKHAISRILRRWRMMGLFGQIAHTMACRYEVNGRHRERQNLKASSP